MKTILLLVCCDAIAVAIFCRFYADAQKRKNRNAELLARNRLIYIRFLVDTVYLYCNQPKQLTDHLKTEMSVEKMIAYHILDQDVEIPDGIKCKDRDWLLRELYRKEFSAQQLVIMFGLSNVNSVYVKSCRINKKIKAAKNNIVKKEPAPKPKNKKSA